MPPTSATVISNIIDTLGNVPSVQLLAQLVSRPLRCDLQKASGLRPQGSGLDQAEGISAQASDLAQP